MPNDTVPQNRVRFDLLCHEIARMMLLKLTDEQICDRTNLKPTSLRRLQSQPHFRQILNDLRDKSFQQVDDTIALTRRDLKPDLQRAAEESFDRLEAILMDDATEKSLVRDIGQDFLDRAGYTRKPDAGPIQINIGTLEAAVLKGALDLERQARERLEAHDKLVKPVKEHAAERGNPSSEPPTGPTD